MIRIIHIILYVLLGQGSASFALSFAQEQEVVTCTFKMIVVGEPIRNVYYDSGRGEEELIVYPGRRTKEFNYQGAAQFIMYQIQKSAEGPVRVPVGQFDFKGDISNWLLLVTKGATEGSYAIHGYPEPRLGAQLGGTFTFLNLSKYPVVGVLGKEKFTLRSGEIKAVDASQVKLNDSSQIQLAFRQEDNWKKFYSTFWPVYKDQRWTILLHTQPGSERLVVVKIPERIMEGK